MFCVLRFEFCVFLFALCVSSFSLVEAAEPSEMAQQRYQQGLAYERLGRLTESYSELQFAVALNAADPDMALALGVVASRLGRLDAAQRALEQAITLEAGSIGAYYQLALVYEAKGNKDRALDSWHRFAGLTQDAALRPLAEKHIRHLEGQ